MVKYLLIIIPINKPSNAKVHYFYPKSIQTIFMDTTICTTQVGINFFLIYRKSSKIPPLSKIAPGVSPYKAKKKKNGS
jgi:hypothetical protein